LPGVERPGIVRRVTAAPGDSQRLGAPVPTLEFRPHP